MTELPSCLFASMQLHNLLVVDSIIGEEAKDTLRNYFASSMIRQRDEATGLYINHDVSTTITMSHQHSILHNSRITPAVDTKHQYRKTACLLEGCYRMKSDSSRKGPLEGITTKERRNNDTRCAAKSLIYL